MDSNGFLITVMENLPDQVEMFLELRRGYKRDDVIAAFQKDPSSNEVHLQIEETLPIGEAIGVGIVVKFASEFAWRVYLLKVEPRLNEFGHLIHKRYFFNGNEIPPPKKADASNAPEEKETPSL